MCAAQLSRSPQPHQSILPASLPRRAGAPAPCKTVLFPMFAASPAPQHPVPARCGPQTRAAEDYQSCSVTHPRPPAAPGAHMVKHPWHLTSMKYELGDATRRLSLCFLFSSSAGGWSRSMSHDSTCGGAWGEHYQAMLLHRAWLGGGSP